MTDKRTMHGCILGDQVAKRGFTLIELLVVIGIVAILSAILFPVAASVRSQSHRSVCASNIRQLTFALMMYARDNGDRLPPKAPQFDKVLWPPDGPQLSELLGPYSKNPRVFRCPCEGRAPEGAGSYLMHSAYVGQNMAHVWRVSDDWSYVFPKTWALCEDYPNHKPQTVIDRGKYKSQTTGYLFYTWFDGHALLRRMTYHESPPPPPPPPPPGP